MIFNEQANMVKSLLNQGLAIDFDIILYSMILIIFSMGCWWSKVQIFSSRPAFEGSYNLRVTLWNTFWGTLNLK